MKKSYFKVGTLLVAGCILMSLMYRLVRIVQQSVGLEQNGNEQ